MGTDHNTATMNQDVSGLAGQDVYDAEGSKIGTAGTFYESEATGAPEWVTVKTGLFGTKESFVPLAGARRDEQGLHVSTLKSAVKNAPRIAEDGHLSDQEVTELYRHYEMTPAQTHSRPGLAGPQGYAGTAGPGRAGQLGDGSARGESVVRSEERLRAGTETVETGRVRLRKHVVTREQQVTVPVRREEVHVTREPVTAADAQAGDSSIGIGEEEREVIVHEERPVVAKETVPVERVSLDPTVVQEDRQVSDTVRREEVEIDDSTARK